MRTQFPTRQGVPAFDWIRGDDATRFHTREMAAPVRAERAAEPVLFRFLDGLDANPRPLSEAEIASLGDLFTKRILLEGSAPLTLRELIASIAALADPGLPVRDVFLVAEGAHFRLAGHDFQLNARMVMTWRASSAVAPDIMVSTVAVADNPQSLLQLIAWSDADRSFHYFERKSGAWVWAGSTAHALSGPTRGRGPFDSHINGGLVMKELKAPWAHWHSMSSSIPREAFEPGSELNTDPLFQSLEGAEVLEKIVRTGVRRSVQGRLARDLVAGELANLRDYMRQVLWCTSINLVSSRTVFNGAADGFDLPTTFFFDLDGIENARLAIDASIDVVPMRHIAVDAARYQAAVAAAAIGVSDERRPPARVAGDTHFAFLVPERAFEDQAVLDALIAKQVLSPKLALCLLLVDFANPVFSPERAGLLSYVPDRIAVGADGAGLDAALIEAVRSADAPAPLPEAELLGLWDQADLLAHAAELLGSFQAAVTARLTTQDGVNALVELADSRRRAFGDHRKLAEFRSTLARGATPAHLAMRPDASIFVKTSDVGEGQL